MCLTPEECGTFWFVVFLRSARRVGAAFQNVPLFFVPHHRIMENLKDPVTVSRWFDDACRHFAGRNSGGYILACRFFDGDPDSGDLLRKVVEWVSGYTLAEYMEIHGSDYDARQLWSCFLDFAAWMNENYPEITPEMKKNDWGRLYRLSQSQKRSQ